MKPGSLVIMIGFKHPTPLGIILREITTSGILWEVWSDNYAYVIHSAMLKLVE